MTYRNQCPSEFRGPLPWAPTEAADHQCSGGPKTCKGKHVGCGCGFGWDDAAAAASMKPEAERTAAEQEIVEAVIRPVMKSSGGTS